VFNLIHIALNELAYLQGKQETRAPISIIRSHAHSMAHKVCGVASALRSRGRYRRRCRLCSGEACRTKRQTTHAFI